ncbi:hypothetical protein BD414DRAFT_476013 [Trametes punicea]|nr:hypothetical protein BD414DRAFT_476013 [Trametes punicea]
MQQRQRVRSRPLGPSPGRDILTAVRAQYDVLLLLLLLLLLEAVGLSVVPERQPGPSCSSSSRYGDRTRSV